VSSRGKIIILALFFTAIAMLSLPACSNKAVTTGLSSGSIIQDSLARTYLLYIPYSYDGTQSMPLVIVLHGGGGTAQGMIGLTQDGSNNLADEEGFVAVYPQGLEVAGFEAGWNDGRDERFSQTDDAGFISALIDYLEQTININHDRVYVTGISNGAHMSMCLARELSDRIAAVAPVAYAMPEKYASTPVSTEPVSVLVMTGTEDPLTPWEGGETPDPTGERMLGSILSVPATMEVIAASDNCSSIPVVSWEPNAAPLDGTSVRVETFSQCTNGTEVILYAIVGGGHTWPGGWQYSSELIIGKTCRDIDACEVIWDFFQRHSK